jgi:hypothetical protein
MGTLQSVLSTLQYASQPDINLRDYRHAAKIFGPNNSSLLPKSKNWFHIYFQLNPAVVTQVNQSLSSATSSDRINWKSANLPVLGVLARTVSLPNIKFEVKKNNQYNRWSLNTVKTNYEPISITMWDDTINVIDHFLYAYYQYMNADPNYVNWSSSQTQGMNIPSQWDQSTGNISSVYSPTFGSFGLDTSKTTSTGVQLQAAPGSSFNRTNSFFESIRIYQFNRSVNKTIGPEYNEFVLVNPVITSFEHDTLDFGTSEYMTNKMSIEYETVLYNSGHLNNDEVASWDSVTATLFDNTKSPLGQPGIGSAISSIINTTEGAIGLASTVGSNKGGITSVATVMAEASGGVNLLNSAVEVASGSSIIGVPTAAKGFGTSGNPPLSVGV